MYAHGCGVYCYNDHLHWFTDMEYGAWHKGKAYLWIMMINYFSVFFNISSESRKVVSAFKVLFITLTACTKSVFVMYQYVVWIKRAYLCIDIVWSQNACYYCLFFSCYSLKLDGCYRCLRMNVALIIT